MTGVIWNIQLDMRNENRVTRCEARLTGKDGGAIVGEGTARANPADEDVPYIGDELAAARALSDLSHQLLYSAARDIESRTHQPVQRLRA